MIEAEIERIVSLIRDTHLEDAEQELHSFKRNHPTHDVSYVEMILSAHQTHYQKAYDIGEHLLQIAGQDPLVRFYHARNSIAVGEWMKGLDLFDSVRGHHVFGGDLLTPYKPLWDGQDLRGKILLIACEGGIGDAVCFSRFTKQFAELGAKVILASYDGLFELLRPLQGMNAQVDLSVAIKTDFDYWVPALSCPRVLGIDYQNIDGSPYLTCPKDMKAKWQSLVTSSRPKIGLCWQGNPNFKEDYVRSIPGELFAPMVADTRYEFFKVQVNSENNSFTHPNLKDLTSSVGNPSDLAGFLSQLDLFITVDSGMAHIAGALGVKTLLLNRVMGWFTFGHKPDHENLQSTPWYNSMQILHQKRWGQWDETIARAIKSIPTLL
ncbi:glycosyltransferase family 9 protein [Bdellovibrio sp. HCB2-146]|uniref:glycosyltransferase family 9 protein n=1 Tax=Bdellovibrio sp. HCB2-146 TaxID=3394362 RepID=UPI0039BD5D68